MRLGVGVGIRLGLGLERVRKVHQPKKPCGLSGGDGGGKAGWCVGVSITRPETDCTSCAKARLISCGRLGLGLGVRVRVRVGG